MDCAGIPATVGVRSGRGAGGAGRVDGRTTGGALGGPAGAAMTALGGRGSGTAGRGAVRTPGGGSDAGTGGRTTGGADARAGVGAGDVLKSSSNTSSVESGRGASPVAAIVGAGAMGSVRFDESSLDIGPFPGEQRSSEPARPE